MKGKASLEYDPITALHDAVARPLRLIKPVFVVGCPRSGTTLFGNCLAAHSMLGGADESMFLGMLARIYYGLFQGTNLTNWTPLRSYIDDQTLVNTIRSFSDGIFASLLERLRKSRYIDHTPWYGNWIEFIARLYPDAQFIHVVRDGRDVVSSLAKSYEAGYGWAGDRISARAQLWVRSVASAREGGKMLGAETGRYREVSYEDLCKAPESVLAGLLEYLGLPMEAAVLKPLAYRHANPARNDCVLATVDEVGGLHLHPKFLGNEWPAKWTAEEKGEFAKVAGDSLKALGYSL